MPLTFSAILGSLNKNIDSFTVVRGLKTFLTEEQAKIQYGILSGKIDTLVTFPLSFSQSQFYKCYFQMQVVENLYFK